MRVRLTGGHSAAHAAPAALRSSTPSPPQHSPPFSDTHKQAGADGAGVRAGPSSEGKPANLSESSDERMPDQPAAIVTAQAVVAEPEASMQPTVAEQGAAAGASPVLAASAGEQQAAAAQQGGSPTSTDSGSDDGALDSEEEGGTGGGESAGGSDVDEDWGEWD